ncbi:hypothetical protein HMPREF9554_01712 [Treponema phagedenis F0421]|nr:hypothetical protein HMPREF9554_01712 [Treponema phagedenis F0421]
MRKSVSFDNSLITIKKILLSGGSMVYLSYKHALSETIYKRKMRL